MDCFVGTSGFSYPAWKGSFYPEKWPAKKMLAYYAERFSTVEINNTFYRMPVEKNLRDWSSEVGDKFMFILKAPQRITHVHKLEGTSDDVSHFWKIAQTLNAKLGPVLFQLPPFLRKDVVRLERFIAELPTGLRAAFEFRHASWFDEDVYALLRAADIALCVAEAEKLVTPLVATASWGYVRLRTVDYDDAALAAWAEKIKSQPWRQCFVFFKHEEGATGPAYAQTLMRMVT
jgi:uncharacterized protein YecE (DUF72 family)